MAFTVSISCSAQGCLHYYCTAAAAFMVVLAAALIVRRSKPTSANFPRSPPSWPILGHLPLLLSGCPHQSLAALSLRHGYGPIIGLRLGSVPAIVVSSTSLAKEILLTQDKAFGNRPRYTYADNLYYGYDTGIIWSSYGPHWSRLRKIVSLELFSAKRLHDWEYVREEEMAGLLDRIALKASRSGGMQEAIDVGKCIGEMVSNMMSRLLQSKTLSEASYTAIGSDSLAELVKELEQEVRPTVGDLFPWLKCLDRLQKHRMREVHARFNKTIESILEERREAMRAATQPNHELPHDFLQVLLSQEEGLQTEPLQGEHLTAKDIKAILLDVLTAGIHTSSLTLEWAMAEILRNPRCFQKLRNEIDTVLGHEGGRIVTDEDIPKLSYLQNTVKEVFRLHPIAPLMLPRITLEACKLDKYTLPAGTHVFVNVWAIGRDPHVWPEVDVFWPERFEGTDVDVRGQHYKLLPFGSGRRLCPGLRLGLATVQLTLANLVKTFDWELPHGQTPMSLDMFEKKGITINKASPILAIPKLRQAP